MRSVVTAATALSMLSIFAFAIGPASPARAGDAPVQVAQAAAPPPEAQSASAGTLTFTATDVAAGIGFSWGTGTLSFQGQQRPFKVNGLQVAAVGITKVDGTGEVYNLKNIADFEGTYAAVSVGATFGGGGSLAYLRNQNGVVIKVQTTTQGLSFNFSADGVKFTFGS